MQVLNLIRPEKSDIKFKVIQFPDGEPHIVLEGIDRKDEMFIICKVANPNDLFILMQVGDILNRQGIVFSLKISYLMSMRMDRVISYDEAFSLNIVVNIINSMKPTDVVIVEPHSYKATHLIANSIYESGTKYIPNSREYIYVYPDAGAKARYHSYLLHKNHVYCSKVRDANTGKLSGFKIENPEVIDNNPDLPLIVVDDLCDGGGTFAGIATEIRKVDPKRKLCIYVTHMVNPKGITTLSDNYDEVYFTNSYKDWQNEILPNNVKVIEIV